jgi:peptide/nickel transport system substrate-binding protein
VITLDFPSLIERITRTFNYEVCMLNLTNVGLDPEEQMNVWMSSAANHQWNPNQSSPATPWEKEIDEQMGRLASSIKQEDRKKAFDRVQALVAEHAPFLYLVHPQAQAAVSPALKVAGAPIWPYVLSGLERASVR